MTRTEMAELERKVAQFEYEKGTVSNKIQKLKSEEVRSRQNFSSYRGERKRAALFAVQDSQIIQFRTMLSSIEKECAITKDELYKERDELSRIELSMS
ncbi:hypothetical protein PRIPAC_73370 [Pristionchus pacificus]|uniref:Uncharacterized protein n=1 Tax=Pristionchus pacificus TaxID=54126 RepID=A0A2A6CRL6_PRIPA|nr:hypothetical protein PRIPAC_73370 [Pristionchus pacificus]|eukprot:PDM80736.1 hypothetical protein PRIPAC_35739 [Pristionchus pacificus]